MYIQVKEALKKVDLFGQQISLSFRQEDQYQTTFGGLSSILMIVIILSFFYSSIINFLTMSTVTSDTQFNFENDPSFLRLTKDNYMFAVQIEQSNFTQNPLFNISVEQRHYKRYKNGTQQKMPTIMIDLVPCTIDHFQPIFSKYSKNFTDEFQQQDLNNFLCPNLEQGNDSQTLVGGAWSSEDYYFIKYSVSKCIRNPETNFSWKPDCKRQEEIDFAQKSSGGFRFQLFTINYLINPNKPKEYIQPYLAIDQFYTFIPGSMSISADIFVRRKYVETNKGILMYPDKYYEELPYRELGDSKYQILINPMQQDIYATFYLQRSPYSYQINRSFITLDQLLSYLGGFIQFMIVIMGIFLKFHNKLHLIISMANDLFEFHKNENKNKDIKEYQSSRIFQVIDRQDKSKQKTMKINEQVQDQNLVCSFKADQNEQEIQSVSIPRNGRGNLLKKEITNFIQEFKKFLQKSIQISPTFRIFLALSMPFERFMTDDAYLIKKAIEQVNKELDINYILNKLHEISKLKAVLFSEEQEILFNVTQKPIISLISERQRRSTKYQSIFILNFSINNQRYRKVK